MNLKIIISLLLVISFTLQAEPQTQKVHPYTACKRILAELFAKQHFRNLEASRPIIIKNDATLNQRSADIGYEDPISGIKDEKKTTPYLRKMWNKVELKYHSKLWKENATSGRNVELLEIAKNAGVKHPVEIYGEKSYKAWRKAVDRLDRIKVGSLELNNDMLKDVNNLVVGSDRWYLKIFNKLIPEKYWLKGGGIFRHADVEPFPDRITVAVQKKLEQNKWLGKAGFLPLEPQPKYLPENQVVGYINYVDSREVMLERLDELNTWANNQLKKMRAEEEDAMDPIDLASKYQYRLVSLHPFLDGNGRTTKLFMDRILKEFNLPPPMFRDNDYDIFYTEEEYSQKVRDAVLRSLYVHATAFKNRHTNKWLNEAPNTYKINKKDTPITRIIEEDLGPELNKFKKYMSDNLQPRSWGHVFYFGKADYAERFVMLPDGFFYNKKGIPHLYNPQDNKIYPVAERNYMLYSEMGKANPSKYLRREINPNHKEVYINNMIAVQKLKMKELDPSNVELIPYSVIERANHEGDFHFFDFQKHMFDRVVKIDQKLSHLTGNAGKKQQLWAALYTLSTRRGGVGETFERRFMTGSRSIVDGKLRGARISIGHAVAQYHWMDQKYWEYLKYAEKNRPELVDEIMKSRRLLHAAVRVWVDQWETARDNLSDRERMYFDKLPKNQLISKYLKNSPAGNKKFDLGDDETITLWRSDYRISQVTGIVDEGRYRKLMLFFGGDTFKTKVFELHKAITDIKKAELEKQGKGYRGERALRRQKLIEILEANPSVYNKFKKDFFVFSQLLKRKDDADALLITVVQLLESQYAHAGASIEYDRLMVDLALHMTGYLPRKNGASLSSNVDLYVKESGKQQWLPFVNKTDSQRLYLIKIKRSKLVRNVYNTYLRQYEFVVNKGMVNPLELEDAYKREFLQDGNPENAFGKVEKFFNIMWSSIFKIRENFSTGSTQSMGGAIEEATKETYKEQKEFTDRVKEAFTNAYYIKAPLPGMDPDKNSTTAPGNATFTEKE